MTTEDIIQGCKAKNTKHQKALVERFAPMLLSVCRRYSKNRADADDVLQESLIRILKSIDSFSPSKGVFEGWARKIAINTALKYFDRNCFKKQVIGLENASYQSIEPTIFSKMQADEMMIMIKNLPDGYRQVFNLYAIEGYSHKEISQILGIGESSSRSNLTRARKLLKTQITNNEMVGHELR